MINEASMNKQLLTLPLAAAVCAAFLLGGCEQKSPVDKAVDSTKDALDVRPHEKIKDAAEDARDAVKDGAKGVKDEVKKND
jgi:hypothetical protein